jgi:glycosyltransferase involved in cell wall biosynthesis
MTSYDLSIVIPAFNEERNIAKLLPHLRSHTGELRAQVIVVDNGSTDATRQVASACGADLVLLESGTVGGIRNAGARHALADVLVFVDADVFPTAEWTRRLPQVIEVLRSTPRRVTGSWVSVPDRCSWLEQHWFKPLEHGSNTHINSGHMIISRSFFRELEGFDPSLKSGEDYDISMRAKAQGGEIVDDVALRVIHEGYPKRLGEFARREMWHGAGDFQTIRGLLNSKVAVLSVLVFWGQLAGWIAAIVSRKIVFGLAATLVAIAICIAASLKRYPKVGWRTRGATIAIYFVYFCARAVSPVYRRSGRQGRETTSGARH